MASRAGSLLASAEGQCAELLSAKGGPDHRNAGIRLFRVVATVRRLGAEHDVEKRPRIEGNLPSALATGLAAISRRRDRRQLHLLLEHWLERQSESPLHLFPFAHF